MGIAKYVKPKFVDQILKEEAEIIKGLQMEVADDWGLKDDSGELRKSLRGHFSVTQLGEGNSAHHAVREISTFYRYALGGFPEKRSSLV